MDEEVRYALEECREHQKQLRDALERNLEAGIGAVDAKFEAFKVEEWKPMKDTIDALRRTVLEANGAAKFLKWAMPFIVALASFLATMLAMKANGN